MPRASTGEAHLVNQARKLIGELQQHVELRLQRQQATLEGVDFEEK